LEVLALLDETIVTEDDFKSLKTLWNEGKKLDVALKLKEWEHKEKTTGAKLLYKIWIRRINEKHDYSEAYNFESDILKSIEMAGFIVKKVPIIDGLAQIGTEQIAVECKHSSQKSKIYEGISQLLYYKWRTKNNDALLVLIISGKCKDIHLLKFAQSMGVTILEALR